MVPLTWLPTWTVVTAFRFPVAETWARIIKCGNGPIGIEDLFNGEKEDRIMVFVALLFLAKYGKISLWQDDLPYGQIFLEIKIPWDIGTIEEVRPAIMPAPQSKAVI